MPRSRVDFSESVRRAVAERAGYLCTNPECRRVTVGPHSVDGKSVSTGVAAHIAAAAPGGPRFRAEQSDEDRRSVENALWLCHSCGDLIDKDAARFPEELLRRWRAEHEEFIRQGGAYPTLPTITLMTLQGLSPRMPPAGMAVTTSGDDIQRFRQHEMCLTNPNGQSIRYFRARIQLGEPVFSTEIVNSGAGIDITVELEHTRMLARGTPGSEGIYYAGDAASPNVILAVDPMPPRTPIGLLLTSRIDEGLSVAQPERGRPDDGELEFYMLGEFQYEWHGGMIHRRLLVPFAWDSSSRVHASSGAIEHDGTRGLVWRRVM